MKRELHAGNEPVPDDRPVEGELVDELGGDERAMDALTRLVAAATMVTFGPYARLALIVTIPNTPFRGLHSFKATTTLPRPACARLLRQVSDSLATEYGIDLSDLPELGICGMREGEL